MAAVATAAEVTKATDLISKLKLDASSKSHDAPVAKKQTGTQYGSMDSKEVQKTPHPQCERSLTPLLQEYINTNFSYLPNEYPSTAYYYGGEWEDYSPYVNPSGMKMPSHGVYGDIYHHGYGYAPYSAYSSSPGSTVPTIGHDGQFYGPQPYQYPAMYYQPPPNQASTRGKVSASVAAAAGRPTIPGDATKDRSNGTVNGIANGNNGPTTAQVSKQNSSSANSSYHKGVLSGGNLPSSFHDPKFGFNGIWSPVPWVDSHLLSDGPNTQSTTSASHTGKPTSSRNQNVHPLPHLTGLHVTRPTSGTSYTAPGIMNRMYNQSGNSFRTGLGFVPNFYDSRVNGNWGFFGNSKYNPRGRANGFYGYSNENLTGLSELNRGPRDGRFKIQSTNEDVDSSLSPDRGQFNRDDFSENFPDAKFFVIKSYSEDHIHKSIKYNVWASTPNGNKKLDAAYQEAQEKTNGCPVFLFFSVNTSGQFIGVAEMLGPVDFNKNVEYWQQDKWNGSFPVKWHIVKDVPNNILKHITLENNENKPVTNSRDTQEVRLEQGLQMLKLFKEHISKTSILDDFGFYESRQKTMLEKKAKQHQIQKQFVDGKYIDAVDEKEMGESIGRPGVQKLNGQNGLLLARNPSEENGGVVLLARKPSNENGEVGPLGPKLFDIIGMATNGDVVTNGY